MSRKSNTGAIFIIICKIICRRFLGLDSKYLRIFAQYDLMNEQDWFTKKGDKKSNNSVIEFDRIGVSLGIRFFKNYHLNLEYYQIEGVDANTDLGGELYTATFSIPINF